MTLSVDYRGGTGYGQEYEKANYLQFAQAELDDCLRGGEYLKALPYVDAERVGIWGLSYGGYMTLAALTKSPETFAMGVNIAGVWDQEQWARWRGKKDAGYPLVFVAGLQAPLLNLHGTDDEAVDFGQLDQIVKDCTLRWRRRSAPVRCCRPGMDGS